MCPVPGSRLLALGRTVVGLRLRQSQRAIIMIIAIVGLLASVFNSFGFCLLRSASPSDFSTTTAAPQRSRCFGSRIAGQISTAAGHLVSIIIIIDDRWRKMEMRRRAGSLR